MQRSAWGFVLGLFLACPGHANAPDNSLRPRPSPIETALPTTASASPSADMPLQVQAAALSATSAGPDTSLRPRERPVLRVSGASEPPATAPQSQAVFQDAPVALALLSVPRPEPRPIRQAPATAQVEQVEPVAAVRILPGKSAVVGKKGSVCGDPSIKGEKLAPITSRVRGCGVDDPVRITSIDGVTLNQSAIINCDTARAMKAWIRKGLKPAFGRKDVAGLRVAASYACRPRNNVKGAKISEHGRGNAIDISAIILADGKSVSVAEDWRRSAGKPMKKAYRAACGTFGTTLGPDADRFHRDHMHFDIARQRGGAFCE